MPHSRCLLLVWVLQMCARCNLAAYCGRDCQKRHKAECGEKFALVVRDVSELRDGECPVCLDEFELPIKLPCSHAMCCACLKQLRESQVGTVCPLWRCCLRVLGRSLTTPRQSVGGTTKLQQGD
jgi:hypothetical protein